MKTTYIMKQTITEYDFINAFNELRPDNFSNEGLKALFGYLEQYEEDAGSEVELDVIAFCCEYTESTIQEALDDYDLSDLDELTDNTTVIFVENLECYKEYLPELDGDKTIIYANY